MCIIDAYEPILDGAPLTFNSVPRIYRCQPDWRWESGPLTDYDLWCVLDGRGTFRTPAGAVPLSAGVCLIIPPGCSPSASHEPDHPLSVFALHFDSPGMIAPQTVVVLRVHDVPFLAMLGERCESAAESGGAFGARRVSTLAHEILLLLASEAAGSGRVGADEDIERLMAAVRKEPGRHWTVDALAEQACLSRSQLSRRFEKACGSSPVDFVIQSRLDQACRLLVETRLSIDQIASELGYCDAHYFSRQFRSRFGMSPSAFRSRGF